MKALWLSLIFVLVPLAGANAQNLPDTDVPAFGAVGDFDDFDFGGHFDLHHSSTPQEAAARGLADLIRSRGLYNVLTAQAALKTTEAYRYALENRRRAVESYHTMREENRKYRAEMRGPRLTREQAIRWAEAMRPERLSPSELDPTTGKISWPVLLRREAWSDQRQELQELFAARAAAARSGQEDTLTAEEYQKVRRLTGQLEEKLQNRIRQVRPMDYLEATKFLDSLAYEARLPAVPPEELAMDGGPSG